MCKFKIWFVVFVFLLGSNVFADDNFEDSSFSVNISKKNTDRIRELLMEADDLESRKDYIGAYKEYTKVGKLATAKGSFDYAAEIYIKAINLRRIHRLEIPTIYGDRNRAYIDLCFHLRQTLSDESVYWHEEAIKQCALDRDTANMLKLYKSHALHFMNIYDNVSALKVNEIALPISLAFKDSVDYAINLLDYSDLLNKEGLFAKADSIADMGYELVHKYELENHTVTIQKWSFWFIQLKAFIYFNEGRFKESENHYLSCIDSISNYKKTGKYEHDDLHYFTNIRLGKLYYSLGNYKEADRLFLAAEALLNKPENIVFNRVFLYDNMLQTYIKAGLYKKAFETSEKYREYINTSYMKAKEEKHSFLKDIATLDIENSQKELTLLQHKATQENQEQKEVYYIVGGVSMLIVLLMLLLFYKKQNDTNKQLVKMNKTIGEQRDQITSSIEYAKKIQKAILPSNELMKICLPFSFVYYRPRDIVSGDFYWVHSIGEKVLIACADSTGHGVPGAIVSMIGNNGLNTCVNEYGLSKPSQILEALNKYVEETFEKSKDAVNDGMDIALCLIDFNQQTLEYAGANMPLYTVRGNVLDVIKADKQPIGRFDYRKPFTNHVISFNDIDNVYLTSDGIQDQFGGAKGKKFKLRRLKRLLLELSQHPINEQQKLMNETFLDWKEDEEQVDDVCFIGIYLGG
jgi:serine phosphatase RsbU (regulator of sigma subunit)